MILSYFMIFEKKSFFNEKYYLHDLEIINSQYSKEVIIYEMINSMTDLNFGQFALN